MTNIEKENSTNKNEYQDRIKKVLENRVMTPREIAEELKINMDTDEYFKRFLIAFNALERKGNVEFSKNAELQLAKRQSDGKYVYYRKQDEDDLVSGGVLGPEYIIHSIWDHYKSVEEIKDLMT